MEKWKEEKGLGLYWNEYEYKNTTTYVMTHVEDKIGTGTQDASVQVKLKKKKNEAVIEDLVVTSNVDGE